MPIRNIARRAARIKGPAFLSDSGRAREGGLPRAITPGRITSVPGQVTRVHEEHTMNGLTLIATEARV